MDEIDLYRELRAAQASGFIEYLQTALQQNVIGDGVSLLPQRVERVHSTIIDFYYEAADEAEKEIWSRHDLIGTSSPERRLDVAGAPRMAASLLAACREYVKAYGFTVTRPDKSFLHFDLNTVKRLQKWRNPLHVNVREVVGELEISNGTKKAARANSLFSIGQLCLFDTEESWFAAMKAKPGFGDSRIVEIARALAALGLIPEFGD